MPARDAEPQVPPSAPVDEGAAGALLGETVPQLREILNPAEQTARAKLWARQNRLEGFLIHARGSAWWHARRNTGRTEGRGDRVG